MEGSKSLHDRKKMKSRVSEPEYFESGMWSDDITFCTEECDRLSCPRNQKNIRDHSIPHSFSVGLPPDCPKVRGAKSPQ